MGPSDDSIRILLAAGSGVMRTALMSFLMALEGVGAVTLADSVGVAVDRVRELGPHVLILDADLFSDDGFRLMSRLRAEHPRLTTILLANSHAQQKAALAAGASHALLKGFLGESLRSAVVACCRPGAST